MECQEVENIRNMYELCFKNVDDIQFELKPKRGNGRIAINHGTHSKDRRTEAAADPVLEAKTFDYLVKGILKYFFGATEDLRLTSACGYSTKRRGVLGCVQWYAGIPETNQRKTLHCHFLLRIWELDNKFLSRKIHTQLQSASSGDAAIMGARCVIMFGDQTTCWE